MGQTEQIGRSLGKLANAVTYSPYTHKFYAGAIGEDYNVEGRAQNGLEAIAVLDPSKLSKLPSEVSGGRADGPKSGKIFQAGVYDRKSAIKYLDDRMVDRAYQYQKGNPNYQGASDVVSLANLTRVELMTEIIDRQYKDVFLINGVRKVPVPKLRLDFDIQLHIKRRGTGALYPKRQRINVEAPQAVQAHFDMVAFGKLARNIDTTDEDELSALISPLSIALEDLAQIMSQDENLLIQNSMVTSFDSIAGTDWGAYSSGASTNNPLDDVTTQVERIVDNYGKPMLFATEMRTLGKWLSNLRVRGLFPALDRDNNGGVGNLPGFPGLTRITDTDLPYGYAFIWDQRALSYGEGPMISESYRDPQSGVSGHVIRKWVEPLVPSPLSTDWTTMLTGVAT